MLSPIEHLPPELLLSIFESGTDQLPEDLTRVSKRWNRLVGDAPFLWQSVPIHQGSTPSAIQRYISNTRDLPIDIIIKDKGPVTDDCILYLRMLASQSERWRSLNILHPEALRIHHVLLSHPLPSLQHLSVRTPETSFTSDDFVFSPWMGALRSLSLTGFPVKWRPQTFSKLHTLEYSSCPFTPDNISSFFNFLEASPLLEQLALTGVSTRQALTSRRVTLRNLKTLVLRDIHAPEILRWIVAPSLRKLVVERDQGHQTWRSIPEIDFPTVEEAEVAGFSTSTHVFRQILHAIPNVSVLFVRHHDLNDPIQLVPDLVLQERTLVNLACLTIHGVFSLEQLRRVVERHLPTLKTVRTHCFDLGLPSDSMREEFDEHDEALAWLQAHVDFHVDHTPIMWMRRYRRYQEKVKGVAMTCHVPFTGLGNGMRQEMY